MNEPIFKQADVDIELRIQDLLSRMPPAKKAEQLVSSQSKVLDNEEGMAPDAEDSNA